MKISLTLILILAAGLSIVPVRSAPPEDAEELAFVAKRLIRENCLICHSSELIASQRLAPAQWKATVEKMVGWGSPILKDGQSIVIDYLASTYSSTEKPARLERVTVSAAYGPFQPSFAATSRQADAALGKAAFVRNCANCHGTDAQGADLGGNLLEKASLWRDADLAKIVHEGRGRMPAFTTTIDDSSYSDMIAWLRARKYEAAPPR